MPLNTFNSTQTLEGEGQQIVLTRSESWGEYKYLTVRIQWSAKNKT